MLEPYLSPVGYAFLTFPVAALLFTLPFLIIQYRRHGYVNKWRGFLLYLFLLYLMNAIYLVLLPMPPTRHNDPPDGQILQLIPFLFIDDILRETNVNLRNPLEYINLLRERAVLQNLFNVMLTIPFGMFMRYYFRLRWFSCLAAAFALSLFFEVTQVTGIYGYFDHPYRLFDVDDLLTNTFGGMVGYLIAERLSKRLPRMDRLDDTLDLTAKRVSYTRRALAFGIDNLLLLPVYIIAVILFNPLLGFLAVLAYHILVPYWFNGRTVGRAIVRIAVVGSHDHLQLREITIRQTLLYGFLGLNTVLVPYLEPPPPFRLILSLASLGLAIAVFIHVMLCLFNHQRRMWHEQAGGTGYRITGSKAPTAPPEQNAG
ncbi:VanZ family protein [Paenibacillus sp. 1P07SE]|uniref:VanZ family protein n=1 Tax=Paenibacillus sp. 1P07SE TaxID=3132209 RepID=UPI0039A4888E